MQVVYSFILSQCVFTQMQKASLSLSLSLSFCISFSPLLSSPLQFYVWRRVRFVFVCELHFTLSLSLSLSLNHLCAQDDSFPCPKCSYNQLHPLTQVKAKLDTEWRDARISNEQIFSLRFLFCFDSRKSVHGNGSWAAHHLSISHFSMHPFIQRNARERRRERERERERKKSCYSLHSEIGEREATHKKCEREKF